jgi:hypothetical protein
VAQATIVMFIGIMVSPKQSVWDVLRHPSLRPFCFLSMVFRLHTSLICEHLQLAG